MGTSVPCIHAQVRVTHVCGADNRTRTNNLRYLPPGDIFNDGARFNDPAGSGASLRRQYLRGYVDALSAVRL